MGKASTELVGRTIAGKFLVEDLIGSGAMGAVYRARQIALDKTVAIKVLHGEHADDATFAARFQREAKAASRLNHPNSMQVIDFGEEPDGLLYIAMEYLDGRSLHRVLREEWPLPPARIVDILMQTLAALAVAHDMGVVHRDLKPDNIVILKGTDDDGHPRDIVKVCDFGIAKITDSRAYRSGAERESNAPVTTAGFLVGTPEYMSPEQGRGEKLDARSDLYSVGVILFEMLTRQVPFEAENAIGVVLKHITEPMPSILARAPEADRRLVALCERAMSKRLEDRYANARDMRLELRGTLEGAPVLTPGPGTIAVRVAASQPPSQRASVEQGYAATVELAAPSEVSRAAEDTGPKPTFAGTTTPIEGLPRRRRAMVVGLVGVAAVLVGVVGVQLSRRSRPLPVAAAPSPSEPPETTLVAGTVAAGVPSLEPIENASHSAGLHGAGAPSAHGGHAAVAPSASASSASVAPPVPSVAPPPASAATAAPSASVAGPPAPTSSSVGVADPDFDPARAYVEIGLINAQGVRERAVRGALHNLGFNVCYRKALSTQGQRAVGVATLSLSIDETGATRSAIVIGADFLPGLARCVQGAAAKASVAASMVDSGGGTADVTVAFRAP